MIDDAGGRRLFISDFSSVLKADENEDMSPPRTGSIANLVNDDNCLLLLLLMVSCCERGNDCCCRRPMPPPSRSSGNRLRVISYANSCSPFSR